MARRQQQEQDETAQATGFGEPVREQNLPEGKPVTDIVGDYPERSFEDARREFEEQQGQ